MDIQVGRFMFDGLAAHELIAGYAFGTFSSPWQRRPPAFGDQLDERAVPAYGYRTYDCVPAAPGTALAALDLLVPSGLNGRLDVQAVAELQRVAGAVSDCLQSLADVEAREGARAFWQLSEEEVQAEAVVSGSVGWWMHRCWWLLMQAPHVGVAVTHKLLHHKRPELFPLLDNRTVEALPRRGAWLSIHQDLHGQASSWAALEEWFAALPGVDVHLTRLRLHDILLWAEAKGYVDGCRALGRDWAAAQSGSLSAD